MADAKKLIPIIKKWEGGYSNNPLDKGGPTMQGITLATYKKVFGYDKTAEDLKKITDIQWATIFKKYYWDICKADYILSQSVANILVDWVWMSGASVIKKVQKILSVPTDGIVGVNTLAAINTENPRELFDKIVKLRKSFYEDLIKRNPSQKVFLNGWMNRLNSFKFEG